MDAVLAIIAQIAGYPVVAIGRQLGYLIQYTSNIDSLRAEAQNLEDVHNRVQRLADAADRKGQVVGEDVQRWLTSAKANTAELNKFLRDEVNPNQRCSSFSSCPNFVSRYKVSRKANKKKLVVDDQLKIGRNFGDNNVSFDPPPPAIPEAVRINVGDVEVFKSRDLIYNGIIEALKDDKTNIIGVYGMGGIGKTTLVNNVANQLVNDYKLFDQVVMAVVSQNPNITNIKDDIASTLGRRKLEQISKRAHQLCEGTQKPTRILVILDDLWTMLDLNAIGLPQVDDLHKDCKILLTTRNRHVCVEMGCQEKGIFQIGEISELEAWNLFKKLAGDVVHSSSDLKRIAPMVAKECAGLPLCIVTVARTLMKVKEISSWEDTLRRLQNPSTDNIPEMIKEVYPCLKFSYDFVNDKKTKICFLLCCLADEDSDIRINNLVGFGMGLGIFDDGCTLPQIKDTVRASVTILKYRCLLLEGEYANCVRMHDVVRDFAIYLLVSEVQHRSWARLGKNILSFSVLNNDKFEFSTLKMLSLRCTDESLVIVPDNFFEPMKDLRVLSINNIPVLPSSVRYLVNLQTLCIEDCHVQDLSSIGELKFLETLSFNRCHIQEFPKEIEKLKTLRVLELRNCDGLEVIPTGVISSLSKLEGLYMYMSLVKWGKDGNASLIELNDLHCLRIIDMHLPDVKLFPRDLRLENLLEFKISLGTKFSRTEWNDSFLPHEYEMEFKCLSRQMLKVGNVDQSISSHDGIKMLVNQAKSLIINQLEVDPENILSDLRREGFSRLKYLKVTKTHRIECLDDTRKEAIIFPDLEGLKLHNMRSLTEICRYDHPSGSFGALCELDLAELPNLQNLWVGNVSLPKLRVVKIRCCDSLKNLFSQNIDSHVKLLSLLQVEYCQNIEDILAFDGAEAKEEDEIELSKLKILKLTSLPKLTTFYSKRRNHISDGSIDDPPPIKAFFSEKIAFPNLEELYISGKFEVILPEKLPGNSLCRLRILDIDRFPKIKTAIPSNLVQRFQNLEQLRVADCELVEEVVEEVPKLKNMMSKTISCCGGLSCLSSASQEIEETAVVKIVLPRLKRIELKKLQKLACFYNGNCTLELPLLTSLTIENCPKLETLFISSGCEGKEHRTASSSNNAENYVVQSMFNEKVLLPSLERLNIYKLDLLEKIWWYNQRLPADSFSQLKYVRIKECDCLRNLLMPSVAKVLSSVTDIEITRCLNLEVVVAEEEEICITREEEKKIIVFPQLTKLKLFGLPQLKCLYNGHCKLEFPSLATVDIRYCPKIETIWASTTCGYNKCTERRKQSYDDDSEGSTNITNIEEMMIPMLFNEQVLLPSLERLNIKDLKFLKEIWYNQGLPADSFSQLKYLHIQECHCLRNLLTPSIVKVLSSLSDIKIGECSNLEVVVAREEDQRRQEICIAREEEKKIIVFPQLTKLELFGLPQLKCFYYGHCKLEFPSLAIVEIIDCPKIETICASATASTNIEEMIPMLFSEQVLLPSLEKLYIDNLTLLKEIWHNQRLPADSFRQLKDLSIIKCDCVRNLLTPSIAKVLSSLIDIKIGECSSLEVVVAEEEDQSRQEICVAREEEKKIILFPQLKNLKLSGLPQLKCLYNGHCKLEFPSLATVEIRYCPKIPMLFSEQVLLPSLEKLNIDSLELLEKIWWYKQRLLAESFSQLKYLSIEECDCLRNLLTPSIVKVLSSLTDLAIRSCSSLEVVVAEEEDQSRQEIIVFPQLTELRLWGLPQLKCLYNGHCKLEFPSLATVDIRYCPKIETRCASTTASTNIAEMIPMLFSEQVLMPNLKRLDMRGKAKLLRRERIAKRMRDLQELVPSCSKDELYGLPCGSSRQRKMSTT